MQWLDAFADNLHRKYEPGLRKLGITGRAYADSILGNLDEINKRQAFESPSPAYVRVDFTLTVPGTTEIMPNVSRDGVWEFAYVAWESDPTYAAGNPTLRFFTDGETIGRTGGANTDYRANGKLLFSNNARYQNSGLNFPIPLAGTANVLVTLAGVTDPASPVRGFIMLKHTPAKHPTPVKASGIYDLPVTKDEPDLGVLDRHLNTGPGSAFAR